MSNYLSAILVGVFAVVWAGFGFYWLMSQPKSNVVVYDCSISEISPDFPPQAREACRKARAQK